MTQTLSWMVTFIFWNALLTSKILEFSLWIDSIVILILNKSACATGLYDWSKSIPLIWELPFSQWRATNFHALEQSPYLIIGALSEQRTFFPSGRDLIGVGAEIRLTVFIVILNKMSSFYYCLWGTFKTSPIFFGVGGLFGRRTLRCETTGLTWSNLEKISPRSVLW